MKVAEVDFTSKQTE